MIKITHIITGLDVGGAELALKRIAEYSEKQGIFYNKIISLTSIGTVGKMLQNAGIEVTALNMRNFFDIPHTILKIIKLLKTQNPEIVQTWLYHADLLGGIASRLAGIKNIFWGIRSADILAGAGVARNTYFIMKICALLSHFLPTKIVCVAQVARINHRNLGYSEKKLKVIANGFEINKHDLISKTLARQTLSIPQDAVVIGSVGRFNEYKDHKNFIKAVTILAKCNQNLLFLMIGRNVSTDNKQLMGWINDTAYAKNFILLGERSDVNLCFRAMDIFCLHSRSEAFPNVVVEAMYSGVPCVVTDAGDAANIVGENGVVVPVESPEELAKALQQMINLSAEKRAEIGEKSRIYAMQNYSLDAAVRKYEALYKEKLKNE